MAEWRRSPLLLVLLVMLAAGPAQAQSGADPYLSIQPPPPGPVILSPVVPGPPPPPAASLPGGGPIGSYASDAPGPDLRQHDVNYVTPFPMIHRLPPGATVREVRWRYGVAARPPGFDAMLCWKDAATCWDVSGTGDGSTTFFRGKDASVPFLLIYRVRGSGPMAPIKGAMNQVIVSFDIPR